MSWRETNQDTRRPMSDLTAVPSFLPNFNSGQFNLSLTDITGFAVSANENELFLCRRTDETTCDEPSLAMSRAGCSQSHASDPERFQSPPAPSVLSHARNPVNCGAWRVGCSDFSSRYVHGTESSRRTLTARTCRMSRRHFLMPNTSCVSSEKVAVATIRLGS